MKALVGDFNQEKDLVGAFSVILKNDCETDGALHSTYEDAGRTCDVVDEWWRGWLLLTPGHQFIFNVYMSFAQFICT